MSLILTEKRFLKHSLAVAVTTFMVTTTHAGATEQQEIQQLRAEVAELRALIQQQAQTQQNIIAKQNAPVAAPSQVPQAPAMSANTTKPKVTIDPANLKVTTDKGAEVKLYGFVRADANYIVRGSDTDFNSVSNSTEIAKDKLRSTTNTTRFGLDFKTPLQGQQVGGKVEVDFGGGANTDTFRIRHAYLTYNDWLIGQTTSNFLGNHSPEMIDFATSIGQGTRRIPQVRYGTLLAPKTQLIVSAERGESQGLLTASTNDSTKYALPVLTAKVLHNFADGKGATSVRALAENYKGNNSDDKTGWGIAVGANYKITDPLKAFIDYSHVKGNSSYLYGSNRAYVNTGGDLSLNEFDTFQTGLTYQILPNLRSTLAYGAMYADDNNDFSRLAVSQNKEVRQTWLNLIYSPAKPIDVGLEYINGKRETFAGNSYDDNRIGMMARYNF